MMDQKKPLLHLLKLLLLLSAFLSQGTLASRNNEAVVTVLADKATIRKILMEKEKYVEGRMDIENDDYVGSGANNRHDFRGPGRA